jgi:hypothetical protein
MRDRAERFKQDRELNVKKIYAHLDEFENTTIFNELLAMMQNHSETFPVDSFRFSVHQIAFWKLHKTGSTTFSSVIYRYSCRNNLRMFLSVMDARLSDATQNIIIKWLQYSRYENASKIPSQIFDTIYVHIQYYFVTSEVLEFFNIIIDRPRVITMIREPLSHAISYAVWRFAPANVSHLNYFIEHHLNSNTLCQDLHLQSEIEIDIFMNKYFQYFELVCLTDAFDECLVMMKRRFNWQIVDITYLALHDAEVSP